MRRRNNLASSRKLVEGYTGDELSLLRRFVSPAVQSAICTRALHTLNCFTTVTVLSLRLRAVDLAATNPDFGGLNWGQVLMEAIQNCVDEQEGSLNQFSVEGSDASMLCAWGLAPFVHIDDPYRAISAAVQLNKSFEDLGIQAQIGVTTGKVSVF